MPVINKVWSFESDAEGLSDRGNTASITFAWQTGYSQSASGGCVKFTMTSKSATATEYAYNSSTGATWQTWGVPINAKVTTVQITSWYERTVAVTKLTTNTVNIYIINSDGTTVHSAGNLIAAYDAGTTADSGAWVSATAGSARAVDAAYQASSTDVRLRIDQSFVTGGTSSAASVDQRYDTITLAITYECINCVTNVISTA